MKKLVICLCLVGMGMLGCKDVKETVQTIELRGTVMEAEEMPFMRVPHRVELDGRVMAVLDLAADSMSYHFVEYPSIKYLCSAGRRGNGADEILLPTPFQFSDRKAYLMDGANSLLYTYAFDGDSVTLSGRWKVADTRTLDYAVLNDTTLLLEDFNGTHRLYEVTPTTRRGMFSIPGLENGAQADAESAYLWRSYMAYNASLHRVALATQNGYVIEVYDLKDGSSDVQVGQDGAPRDGKGQIEGFHDIKWINDTIYTLYSGRLREELIRKLQQGQKEPDGGNLIKVYNRDGEFVRQYRLDTYINGFTYDAARHRLIGVGSNQDNPFVYFNL